MARLGSPVAGGVSRSPRGWARPDAESRVRRARALRGHRGAGVHRVPAELQLAPRHTVQLLVRERRSRGELFLARSAG